MAFEKERKNRKNSFTDNDVYKSRFMSSRPGMLLADTEQHILVSQLALTQEIGEIGSWSLDLKTNRTLWSDELFRIHGRDSSLGPPDPDVYMENIHPEDRQILQDAIENSVETGRYSVEYRLSRYDDGSERMISATGRVEFDDVGRPIYHTGVAQDITEQQLLENALHRSEIQYELLFNRASEGIGYYDPQGKVLAVNAIALERIERQLEEVIGLSVVDLFGPDFGREVQKRIDESITAGRPQSYDDLVSLPIGTKWYLSHYAPVADSDGAVHGVIVISTDITERKDLEREVLQDGEMVRDLAHHLQGNADIQNARTAREIHDDLGQMLTAIDMHLARIARVASDNEKVMTILSESRALVRNAVQSSRQIVDRLHPAILDYVGIVDAIKWLLSKLQETTSLIIEPILDESVELSESQSFVAFRFVEEALTNVLRHSQATRATVSISKGNGLITLSVEDNGIGTTVKIGDHNSGYGLTGLRERADRVDGLLHLESQSGNGTTIFLSFPYKIFRQKPSELE
jgi:PAS domain S-box-containing protein